MDSNINLSQCSGTQLQGIFQICQKPVDELVDLLGLDIPPVPDVSLAGITSDSVLLYWKPVDTQSTTSRNTIQVNGIKVVGDFGIKDTSIQVTGLKPGQYYNIRVIATNSANFSTLSPLIRLRTVQSPMKDGNELSKVEDDAASGQMEEGEPAGIRAGRSQLGSPVHPTIHPAAKEASAVQTSNRRTVLGRRVSPVISAMGPPSLVSSRAASLDEDDSGEVIQRLTEQLDRLRREQQETDKQVCDEDREHLVSFADLSRDRDHLRHILKEKEESTAELRKHGGHLEKINRTAQNRKLNKERFLAQKKTERCKIQKDIGRWDNEIALMRQESEQVGFEKDRIRATTEEDIPSIRKLITGDHDRIRQLEDEIRVTGVQIKSMEKDREHSDGNEDDEQVGLHDGTSSNFAWEMRAQAIQTQLATLWHTLQQVTMFFPEVCIQPSLANRFKVETENQQAQERLGYWNTRRSRDPSHFAALPTLDYPLISRPARNRRLRQVGNRINAAHPPFGTYQMGPLNMPFNPTNASPQYPSVSPFFNMSNGMAVPEVAGSQILEQFSQPLNDSELLTGGGAMSPTANDLLPSNLFRDDDMMVLESPKVPREDSLRGGASGFVEAHSDTLVESSNTERPTPGSTDSRRGSLLSSPQGSIRNFHSGQSSVDAYVDNDRLSTHSTGASILQKTASESNPLITSRLAQFFPALNRQREKSSTREPPALGTLKQGQSQSFPRNMDQAPVNTLEIRHRRGSYGNWSLPMAGLLDRSGSATEANMKDTPVVNAHNTAGPRHRLNMFGSRVDTEGSSKFRERSSSRPSSIYSFEQIHGRPASDSQRLGGWPVADTTPSRSSPLNANWSISGGPWSRIPSRRPSIQHGSTSNLSIGSTPLESDAYDHALAPTRSEQQPIGTRPRSSQRFATPRLNPAAPNFKTIFGRSEARKAAKAEKASEKAAEKERVREAEKFTGEELTADGDELSPSQPRLSRDTGSTTTAGSTAESHDSLEHSTSGTTSEAAASSGPRESLMQKITRKSSSSKFNVLWAKERGGLFSKKGEEPSTPCELDEDVSKDNLVTKGGENTVSTPQQERGSRTSLSWPNMRRKSKKGGLNVEKGAETADDDEL
ncbi:MAG: hypothetical protein Q9210_000292 [Variospora velana]